MTKVFAIGEDRVDVARYTLHGREGTVIALGDDELWYPVWTYCRAGRCHDLHVHAYPIWLKFKNEPLGRSRCRSLARPPSPAIRPLTSSFLVAGAGFEPTTSGL